MRTRKVMFVLLLIAVGLLFTGCFEANVIQPAAGKTELGVNFKQPENGGKEVKLVITGERSIEFKPDEVIWFYDIPENQPEYLLVGSAPWVGYFRYLHLRQSKNPNPTPPK